jgi:hypothetical protein
MPMSSPFTAVMPVIVALMGLVLLAELPVVTGVALLGALLLRPLHAAVIRALLLPAALSANPKASLPVASSLSA